MKKLSLLFIGLCLSVSAHAANTIQYRDKSIVVTSSQISTAGENSTTPIDLGPFQAGSLQCRWGDVSGGQPEYKLQLSNDNTNWDDVTNATITTSGASGSETWNIDPFVSRYARVLVYTASSAGTLDCITVLK